MVPPSPSYSTKGSYYDSSYSKTSSLYTTDFSVTTEKPKPVTGADFYDRSRFSKWVALSGLFVSFLVGIACTVCSIHVLLTKGTVLTGVTAIALKEWWQRELLVLGINLLVALCSEATGFVHSIALRAALASEQRLRFNTNLRLLNAAGGTFHPNGRVFNGLMGLLLVVAYSSAILVTLEVDVESPGGGGTTTLIYISNVPLLVLSVTLLLQSALAVVSMTSANILTWSSSPFDITAALVHHTQIIPVQGRCMHGITDVDEDTPLFPREKQPSAWQSHSSIRKVIFSLWALVVACFIWGIVVACIAGDLGDVFGSWSFLSDTGSYVASYPIPLLGDAAWLYWMFCYLNIMLVQAWMTFALYCSELVVNVIRDEQVWRRAATKKGAKVWTHPLAAVYESWLSPTPLLANAVFSECFLLYSRGSVTRSMRALCGMEADNILDWMLSLAISLGGTVNAKNLASISISMYPVQVRLGMNYVVLLFPLTSILHIMGSRSSTLQLLSSFFRSFLLSSLVAHARARNQQRMAMCRLSRT